MNATHLRLWLSTPGMVFLLACCLALSACGGGGGGGSGADNNREADLSLSEWQADAIGTNSLSDTSGITVTDRSDCRSAATAQPNVVPVCVDDGPINPATGESVQAGNRPFVTVRLCEPGSTTRCINIDHMIVDTGSTGVRVAVPALPSRLDLPAVTTGSGQPVAECMQFISGWTWGSLNKADVYIGGLVARNITVQMMGHSSINPQLGGSGGGAFPAVPTGCSNASVNQDVGQIAAIGGKGILGVGVWPDDSLFGFDQFYVCPSGRCTSIYGLTQAQKPNHPGMYFPSYPAGTALRMAATGRNGARNLKGTLTFGITSLPVGASQLALSSTGTFTTRLNGVFYPYSYIDSGSIDLTFDAAIPSITRCSLYNRFYCPNSLLQLTALHIDSTGNQNEVSFEVGNAESLISSNTFPTALNNLAGPTYDIISNQRFAWGFPFFIGRTVYTVILGTPLGGTYGVVAYTQP